MEPAVRDVEIASQGSYSVADGDLVAQLHSKDVEHERGTRLWDARVSITSMKSDSPQVWDFGDTRFKNVNNWNRATGRAACLPRGPSRPTHAIKALKHAFSVELVQILFFLCENLGFKSPSKIALV